MSNKMTRAEREAFLAEVRVCIMSIPEEGRGPLTIPVWYNYEPGGDVRIWTGGSSRKVQLLRQAGRFSLCVQDDQRPYRYVSVEGPVVAIEPVDRKRELEPMVFRYLSPAEGRRFIEGLGGDKAGTGDVLIRMKPERWLTGDYSK